MLDQRASFDQQVADLEHGWNHDPRWSGIKRGYSAKRGSQAAGQRENRAHPG